MKPKICKFEGCEKEVTRFPNSYIWQKFCLDHAIKGVLSNVRKESVKKARSEKIQKTADLMSVDQYRAKFVQPIINEIARLIDFEQPCIATGLKGKMSGGHYWSVGSNRTVCLNLHNIHVQSFHSNSVLSGDMVRYRAGIIKTYGITYMYLIESLKTLKPIKISKSEMIDIKNKALAIRNELKKDLKILTPEERIKLREFVNNKLGIYEPLF